jgi:hypothetical protein
MRSQERAGRRLIIAVMGVVCASALFASCAVDSGPSAPTTSALVSTSASSACNTALNILPGKDAGDSLDLGSDVVTLEFGEQVIGSTPQAKSFTVQNVLRNPILIASLRYNAANYNVSAPPAGPPVTLAPAQTVTFVVTFHPANLGAAADDLTFQTDQPASTGIDACHVELDGVGVNEVIPPRVSGPFAYTTVITSSTVGGDGVTRSCNSNRQSAGTLTLNLQAGPNGTVGGTANYDDTEQEAGGTCGGTDTFTHHYSGPVTGTPDNIQFNVVTPFSTTLVNGSETINFAGHLSGGVVSGTLARVQSFVNLAGNGGGGGSASTTVNLH